MNRNQEESPSDQTSSCEGNRLRLVISYASEDVEIASAIAKNLELALPSRTIDVWFDKNLKLGETWKKELNNKLDNADILITISTGKKKASHSFTGFEVGYFIASMKHRPKMPKKYNNAERFVIPIAIYTGIPETMDDFQGLEIPIQVINIDQDSLQNKDNIDYQDKKNPFYLLFSQVASIIKSAEELDYKDIEPLEKDILEYSKKLHIEIINELRKRISNERFQERKIIVRVKPPMTGSNDIVPLNNATIELIGPSFEIFGFNTQFVGSISCNTLIDKIINKRYRTAWEDNIKSLVSSAKNGEFRGNLRTITSNGGQRFQLFVSKCVQINSGEDEIHIHVVEIYGQDHGDPRTAMLLKAVSIGLNFRFMFLEKTSKFSPNTFNYALGEQLKDKVYNLIQELDWLIWMSKDSGLYEADNLNLIYEDSHEDGEIDRQNNLWEEQKNKLWDVANEMLNASHGSEVEIKKKFIQVLREFCDNTHEMNRDFTSRSLEALQKIFSASKEHRKRSGSGVMCDAHRVAVGPDVLSESAVLSLAETKHKATETASSWG